MSNHADDSNANAAGSERGRGNERTGHAIHRAGLRIAMRPAGAIDRIDVHDLCRLRDAVRRRIGEPVFHHTEAAATRLRVALELGLDPRAGRADANARAFFSLVMRYVRKRR